MSVDKALLERIDYFIDNKANMNSSEQEDFLVETIDNYNIPYSKYDLPRYVLVEMINNRILKRK